MIVAAVLALLLLVGVWVTSGLITDITDLRERAKKQRAVQDERWNFLIERIDALWDAFATVEAKVLKAQPKPTPAKKGGKK